MPKTIFERVLEIAQEQNRSLEEPCLELNCSFAELEQRINSLDHQAVQEVSNWLGISYYSFFAKEGEDYTRLLKNLGGRRLWDK